MTLTSNNHILELIDRWKQNVPSLATLSQEHARYVEKAAQLKDEVKREVEAAEKERDRKEDQKYIRWGCASSNHPSAGSEVNAYSTRVGNSRTGSACF